MKKPEYYIVSADALPEVLIKTAEAKQALETGLVKTAVEAARKVGISRSAFYKYKDCVSPFYDTSGGGISTFEVILNDTPGALSGILGLFAEFGANILTLSQSMPVKSRAVVLITARVGGLRLSDLLQRGNELRGVVSFSITSV